MSFDKHSNFNKQANFTEVKFGENKPVLEVELNELQQIQNEARADIIRDTIPSGFTQLGEIDYDYCLNNENKIKLKTDSVAYVNGYRINIPKDTIIDIGEAPKKDAREDLLFLEVWREEVNSESKLTKEGGEGQPTISNTIKDTRYPIETTHRVALKWRIRHVANVEPTGVPDLGIFSGWRETSYSMATGQGRLPQPLAEDKAKPRNYFYFGEFRQTWGHPSSDIIDNGLGVCSETDSYAIPMFRLYRKPSCGKSIPFEYSKINPKVDYSKFAKLMKEEKVERVITENIKGRSLVNVASSIPSQNTSDLNTLFSPFNIKVTDVTIIVYDMPKDKKVSISESNATTGGWVTNTFINLTSTNTKIYLPKKNNTLYGGIIGSKDPSYGSWTMEEFKAMKILALEGDWTNKEIPNYFEGLKSLGEDDGNLVTVKNGILSDNTYDINDGNQKLTTFPQVTHVLSENTIIPEIQANVKKGDEVINSLNKLGTKLTTEGTEKIEFTSIKGRTIQNCYPKITERTFNNQSQCSVDNGYIILQGTGEGYKNAFIPVENCLIKPNTQYTLIVDVVENTLTKDLRLSSVHPHDVFNNDNAKVTKGTVGTFKYLVTSKSQLTDLAGLRSFLDLDASGKVKFRVMLLEGDYTKTPIDELPFVDGIQSVGETEDNILTLSSYRKNEFDKGLNYTIPKGTSHTYSPIHYVKNPTNQYTLSIESYKNQVTNGSWTSQFGFMYTDGTSDVTYVHNKSITSRADKVIDYVCVRDPWYTEAILYNVQIEEGTVATEYEPYTGYTQQVYLKEPLRSLPSGVKDEIVGNKVIRKVGIKTINGLDTNLCDFKIEPSGIGRMLLRKVPNYKSGLNTKSDWMYCDSLPMVPFSNSWYNTFESISGANNDYFVIYLKATNMTDFKARLNTSPITVYYELANPVEEYLENEYEKESIKTYQLDEPLRSLPNGVKDEIKDGVLIRRCGEVLVTGKMNFSEFNNDRHGQLTYYAQTTFPNCKSFASILADKLTWRDDMWFNNNNNDVEGIHCHTNTTIQIRLSKTKIPNGTLQGFKDYLDSNPIKVIYELATSIEIPLTEVKPQTANFSLQRQFAEGNWLRELPNGVKDTIENGKVKRRIEKVVIKGTEDWVDFLDVTATTHRTSFKLANAKATGEAISDTFEFSRGSTEEKVKFYITINSKVSITVLKSDFPTLSSFKTWLSKNPVSVLYELETPRDEGLTTENCRYYPYHDFNTYCGSMYVGEGRNYILSDNKMPSEDSIIVETDFREIEDKAKVEDCKYKKCADGYSTNYKTGYRKNLFNIYEDVYLGLFESTVSKHQGLVLSKDEFLADDLVVDYATRSIKCGNATQNYRGCKLTIKFKPNTSYVMSFKLAGQDVQTNHKGKEIYLNPSADRVSFSFVTDSKGDYSFRIETLRNGYFTLTDIQIEEGTVASAYEPCIPTTKYFENTKENDIEDLRHQVSLTGFNYSEILERSFDSLLRGEL